MKTVILFLALAGIGFATFARAQDEAQGVVVASGVRYRFTSVNSILMLQPEDTLATPPVLSQGERLARCDTLVAAALKTRWLVDPADPTLVRARAQSLPEKKSWVVYVQRHQGYRILGPGARLELDASGQILFGGITYEREKLREFRPLSLAALEKHAATAVPHPRVGPVFSQELIIDPLDDAPAELRDYVVFQVRNRGHVEGWQVIVNAETGKIVYSSSTVRHADGEAQR